MKFDRRQEFDGRSRNYPVRTLVGGKTPRSYTWNCATWLNQGKEGACVGFAWAHELAAKPKVIPTTDLEAFGIYHLAQTLDQWDGEAYEGTSVLGGAKAVAGLGKLSEYRWAFSLEELILAVGFQGPAVLGIDWHESMLEPDATGFLRPDGNVVGGHAILCNGVNIKGKYFKLHNSWGKDWGTDGEAKVSFDDMKTLLQADGEACIPVVRSTGL